MRLRGELFPRIEKNFEPCLLMCASTDYASNAAFSIGAIPICETCSAAVITASLHVSCNDSPRATPRLCWALSLMWRVGGISWKVHFDSSSAFSFPYHNRRISSSGNSVMPFSSFAGSKRMCSHCPRSSSHVLSFKSSIARRLSRSKIERYLDLDRKNSDVSCLTELTTEH